MKTNLHLTSFLVSFSLLTSLAVAEEPSVKKWAERRVQDGLLTPLAKKESERSKFSRVRQVTRERRLVILQKELSRDEKGRAFVVFRADARFGDEWQSDIRGCVYRGSGQIFVQRGSEYRPSEFLLGKNVKAVSGVCTEARKDERS